MKIKKNLKDITIKEYIDWKEKNCSRHDKCDSCPFTSANCYSNDKNSWVNNKNLFSNEFLNQEIEIEKRDILTEKEKEYLRNVIKPFRDKVKHISKQELIDYDYEYISIYVSTPLNIGCICGNRNYMLLPYFKKESMYKNMTLVKPYSLEELKL